MKITYITHACLVVEAAGKKILMDPWVTGPSWGANIWLYPPSPRAPEDFGDIDIVYFSHAHEDHFQAESVARLPAALKARQVIIPNFGMPYFEKMVRQAGFSQITALDHEQTIELAPGLHLEMLVNDGGDHDSSVVLTADGSTVFFQTDNLISSAEADRLGQRLNIDLLFAISAQTGIFPGFYEFPPALMVELAHQKGERAMTYAMEVTRRLRAKAVVPYASDLCYLDDLFPLNALHRHSKTAFLDRVAKELPSVQGIRMGPENTVVIENGKITAAVTPQDDSFETLAAYALSMQDEAKARTTRERDVDHPAFADILDRLHGALNGRLPAWKGGDFRVLWEIEEKDGQMARIGQALPGPPEPVASDWPYDLRLRLPAFRLRRLINKDYSMGFLTFQNGSMRCHRHNPSLTAGEREFWHWAMLMRI